MKNDERDIQAEKKKYRKSKSKKEGKRKRERDKKNSLCIGLHHLMLDVNLSFPVILCPLHGLMYANGLSLLE